MQNMEGTHLITDLPLPLGALSLRNHGSLSNRIKQLPISLSRFPIKARPLTNLTFNVQGGIFENKERMRKH